MPTDPIVGPGFSPSIAVEQVRRRPKTSEPVLEGVWQLDGAVSHGGVNLSPDSLVGNERKLLGALLAQPIKSWGDYGDAVARAGVQDPEYWLISAMVKTGTDTLGDLLAAVKDGGMLKPIHRGDLIQPASGLIGRMTGPPG